MFMSMYNDIVWRARRKRRIVYCEFQNRTRLCKKKWFGTNTYKPNGKWDRVAEDIKLNFSESGHPVFRGSSALERGACEAKEKENFLCISVATTAQPFFAQSLPSISSVFAVQWRTCETNWPGQSLVVQSVQG